MTNTGPVEEAEWDCTRVTDHTVTCGPTDGRLAPGESAAVVLYATANSAVASQTVVVEVVDGLGDDAAVLTSSVKVNVPDAGLSPVGSGPAGTA